MKKADMPLGAWILGLILFLSAFSVMALVTSPDYVLVALAALWTYLFRVGDMPVSDQPGGDDESDKLD